MQTPILFKRIIKLLLTVSLFIFMTGCSKQETFLSNEPSTPITDSAKTNDSEPIPTEVSSPIEITTPNPTPSPKPTPTLTPTPTPSSTPTPTPIPVKMPDGDPFASIKVGDDVWYDFYEDNTLVVRGTGATYNLSNRYRQGNDDNPYDYYFSENNKMTVIIHDSSHEHPILLFDSGNEDYFEAKKIIISEGIEELGASALSYYYRTEEIYFPTTLKTIGNEAFSHTGLRSESVALIGLDISKVDIAENAFVDCKAINTTTGLDKYAVATPTPTPTPLPTATPTPDPNNPRIIRTEPMGKNVVFEFWDNGYLYIKGSGAIANQKHDFEWYSTHYYLDEEWYASHGLTKENSKYIYLKEHSLPKEFCDSIHYVIIEEGITGLGSYMLGNLNYITYIQLPSTLKQSTLYTDWGRIRAEIHGYWKQKEFVLYDVDPEDVLSSMWYSINGTHSGEDTFLEEFKDQIVWK